MMDDLDFLKLASNIVGAYVSNNSISVGELPATIRSVHDTLGALSGAHAANGKPDKPPAVSIKQSITPAYLVCLEDGKKLKMLKRYLRSRFKLTPEEYRAKWGLPHDYPMTAPNYSEKRSALAKKSGLGRVDAKRPAPRGKKG
ncbi:MAG TPA: MucR family transcriptional regulator [Rhizomicrobium sp.]|jgi:predicted transcriptional regulator|nr:MucR family transcriptional regulator [Rhizomicrobium sp.]